MKPFIIDFADSRTADNFVAAVNGMWRVHNNDTIQGATRGLRLQRLALAIWAGIPERRPETRFQVFVSPDLLEVAKEMLNFALNVAQKIEPTHPDYHVCIFEGDVLIMERKEA